MFSTLIFEVVAKVKEYRLIFFLLPLICMLHIKGMAQKSYGLVITNSDGNAVAGLPVKVPSSFIDKSSCIEFVKRLPSMLMMQGYAAASVDAMYEDTSNIYIQLYAGEKYEWDNVEINTDDQHLLESLGYPMAVFNQKPFRYEVLAEMYNTVLAYLSNNGYPFANISSDSIEIKDNKISARLNIEKGQPYFIDSIIYEGEVKISKNFIEKFIGISNHSIYSREKIDAIQQRLSTLPYLQLQQPVRVDMLNTGAVLHLYLQPLRSNSINVLIGLLPNNTQNDGKLLFTGDATIGLRNSFGKGETIGINWQQLVPQSPRLDLQYQQPYVFNTSFGSNFYFELYKRDSLFLNIKSQLGVQYELAKNQTGAILLQFAGNNALNVDTNIVKATNRLPDVADINSESITLQYNFFNTNYRFNPRKGNELFLSVSAGSKKIKKNNSITQIKDPAFNADALYDSVKLNTYQLRLQTTVAHYFPLGKQATLKCAVNAGWFQSPNYFTNELFLIGGFKTLRGFDEESIFTNRYGIATIEYRYLLAKNSWLYGFTDFAKAAYKSISSNYSQTYLGIGAGFSVETGAGILNIAFAQGKRSDTKFDFRQSKIHIGFVSLF